MIMTNNITVNLFKNASLNKAFCTSLKNPSQKVVYNGRSWKVGNEEISIRKEKIGAFRACCLKIWHKLRWQCSPCYRTNFKNCVKRLEKAEKTTLKEKTAKTKQAASQVIQREALVKKLSDNITSKQNEITQCKEEIEFFKTAEENRLKESPEMQLLEEEINSLEELKGSINIYIAQCERELRPKLVNDVENFFNDIIDSPSRKENQLSPELSVLASTVFKGIILTKDPAPYSTRIDEKINEVKAAQEQLMASLDISVHENKLKGLEEGLKTLQTDWAKASGAQFVQKPVVVKPLAPKDPIPASQKSAKEIEKFLEKLGKITSPEMCAVWESLLLNLAGKYGDGMVESAKSYNSGKKVKLTFNKPLSIYMLPCDDNGVESYKEEPIGGSILMMEKTLTFTASSKNILNIEEGLSAWARIPKAFAWLFRVPYAQASLSTMEIKGTELIITASKKILLTEHKATRIKPIKAQIKHWKEHGEIPSSKKTPEQFLARKWAKYTREGRI